MITIPMRPNGAHNRLDLRRNTRPCCSMTFPSFRAPETMTAAEQAALLRATAGRPSSQP
jgi:hypothetical protein